MENQTRQRLAHCPRKRAKQRSRGASGCVGTAASAFLAEDQMETERCLGRTVRLIAVGRFISFHTLQYCTGGGAANCRGARTCGKTPTKIQWERGTSQVDFRRERGFLRFSKSSKGTFTATKQEYRTENTDQ